MPKNVMKMPKPSPKRGKNAFDLSHRHVLGASFGELLPVTCLETVPGDYFEINCADLLRAMPMVTSPFLRAKQHLDFWFVPYTDLWHQFNAFITQKSQPQSSAMKDAVAVPHVNLYDIQQAVAAATTASIKDIHGIDYAPGAKKLFDLLGYGLYEVSPGSDQTLPDINLWRIAAYNYIWYNEYRQNYYDDGSRLLQDGVNIASLFNFDDLHCDSYAGAAITEDTYYQKRLQAMFQMRYRCWKKDLYTGLMPSTQFGDVSAVSIPIDENSLVFTRMNYFGIASPTVDDLVLRSPTSTGNATYGASGNKPNGTNNFTQHIIDNEGNEVKIIKTASFDPINTPGFDILALRNAQAVQIWRENALRAGNRVNDNINAHFGEYPSYQRDHRPTYIGSYDAVLNVADVNATAQTGTGGNQSLGDVAGKGLSSLDSKKLKFQTNDFGVIVGIFSLLPEAEYNSDGISRPNQLLDRFDYFAPEMENLGLEAVSSQNFMLSTVENAAICGYAPRYFGYKTKLDKCYGSFKTGNSLQIWCSPKYDVRAALSTHYNAIALSTLYVNPKIFDVNFVADAQTLEIQFLCDFFFNVEAVRPMTVLGLPTA